MKNLITVDGNEAAASVAFRVSESIAIFPITPSSPMAEICDEWASRGKTNLWGVIPEIAEMQSETAPVSLPATSLSLWTRLTSSSTPPKARSSYSTRLVIRQQFGIGCHARCSSRLWKSTFASSSSTLMHWQTRPEWALMRNGPRHLASLRTEVEAWMLANEWTSLDEMRGNMSFQRIPNAAVYERETFRRMFQ